jgi:lipid-A-disaccharide synthase
VPYFTRYGLDTVAVGHPISDGLDKYKPDNAKEKIITLVPGSRMSEAKKLLPVFHKTVDMLVNCGYRDYKFVIPTVETTEKYVREYVENWKTKPDLITLTGDQTWSNENFLSLSSLINWLDNLKLGYGKLVLP